MLRAPAEAGVYDHLATPPAVTPRSSTEAQPAAPSAPREQLAGIQILRAAAALLVLVHHIFEESHALFAPGTYPYRLVLVGVSSVDLFFVISGFIMLHTTWSQIGRPGATGVFVKKRLERILPLYWACLGVFFAAKAAGFYQRVDLTAYPLAASIALLPSHRLFISPAWTLVFEMYFYALFALWIRARAPGVLAIGLSLSSIAIALLASALPVSDVRDYLTNPLAFDFLYGVGLAWLFRRGSAPASPWLLGALGCALIVAASVWGPTAGPHEAADLDRRVRFLLFGIPAALIVYASLSVKQARSRLARWMSSLGDASYALYLTHAFVMTGYARLLQSERVARALPLPAWIALVTALAVALGWYTHRLVERPLARWVRGLSRPLSGSTAAPSAPCAARSGCARTRST